jgi:hypothetical protein
MIEKVQTKSDHGSHDKSMKNIRVHGLLALPCSYLAGLNSHCESQIGSAARSFSLLAANVGFVVFKRQSP